MERERGRRERRTRRSALVGVGGGALPAFRPNILSPLSLSLANTAHTHLECRRPEGRVPRRVGREVGGEGAQALRNGVRDLGPEGQPAGGDRPGRGGRTSHGGRGPGDEVLVLVL